MRIGSTELPHGVMLAPMAGYTDRAMRLICRSMGAEYTVTEMVSATAVVYNDKKTFSLARILPDEGPVALQIFGSDPAVMAEAARVLSSPESGVPPVAIDINMGCPVKKIFSNGEGSALMKNPTHIEKIVEAVRLAAHLPVTVKLRAGIDEKSINAVDCARAAEAGGASAVCIHGRTRVQMYGGVADRKIIENVKKSIHIPLFANGDIADGKSALTMLRDTGADGIAVGRGAVGNPFIFSEILAALEGREFSEPTFEGKIAAALTQIRTAAEDKGEAVAIPEARKQIALYFRGFRGAAGARADINRATTLPEVENILHRLLAEQSDA